MIVHRMIPATATTVCGAATGSGESWTHNPGRVTCPHCMLATPVRVHWMNGRRVALIELDTLTALRRLARRALGEEP